MNAIFELKNGVSMPAPGYGTWQLEPGRAAMNAVVKAIHCGYRCIDTAYSYGNDFYVGKAVKAAEVPRDQLFIANKVWQTSRTGDAVVESCKKTLKLMKLEYLDLYFVHWPVPVTQEHWKEINREVWSGMERLYREGYVRAIGVSNYLPHHILALEEYGAEVEPMVDQIEFHPGCWSRQTLEFCKSNGIAVQGWSPLGGAAVLRHDLLRGLAEKYHKSTAQICLRWALQHGVAPIPRSNDPVRMAENLDLFDFEIERSDMDAINAMARLGCSPYVPDVCHPDPISNSL